MTTLFGDLISQINPNVITICLAIVVISVVIALVRKAIKLAIFIFVIVIGLTILLPVTKDFQKDYKFNFNNKEVSMKVGGQDLIIKKEGIETVTLKHKGLSGYELTVNYKNGTISKTIPTFMADMFKNYMQEQSIKYTEID